MSGRDVRSPGTGPSRKRHFPRLTGGALGGGPRPPQEAVRSLLCPPDSVRITSVTSNHTASGLCPRSVFNSV